MQQELKDSYTPTTASNIKITDTLYDSHNTFGKQPKPHWLNLGQLEDQALDVTPKSSPKPKIAEKILIYLTKDPTRTLLKHLQPIIGIAAVYGQLISQLGLPFWVTQTEH